MLLTESRNPEYVEHLMTNSFRPFRQGQFVGSQWNFKVVINSKVGGFDS